MTNYSDNPRLIDRLLDMASSNNQILTNFIRDVNDLEEAPRFHWLTFQMGRIGPWEQRGGEIGLSDIWCQVFGTKDSHSPCTLQEYVELIDDPEEQTRIYEARLNLQQQAFGTRWESEYTLCGLKIRSIGFVDLDGVIAGLDMILEE